MAGNGTTVWILGSGFSKPLGGPLLRDLFRWQEREDDVAAFFPPADYPDLAKSLPWVQRCFHKGVDEGLWENAEQFMAYVDDGYRGSVSPKRQRVLSVIGASDPVSKQLLEAWLANSDPQFHLHQKYQQDTLSGFDRKVKRALAAECSRFLRFTNPAESELWLPYLRWVEGLRPGLDIVLSFNYDQVVEMAAAKVGKKLWAAMPNDIVPGDTVELLKLHGSVDWRLTDDVNDKSKRQIDRLRTNIPDLLKSPDDDIAIAAPGGSKARFITQYLEPLWERADKVLRTAGRLMVVGYSFPDTDPAAQYRLLEGFAGGSSIDPRWAFVVLGAEDTATSRRVLSLLGSTAGSRDVLPHVQRGLGLHVVRLPLGTQDFIGRHGPFTTPR